MTYPLVIDYIEAIKAAEENFDKLKNLCPVLDESGEPVFSSGNFAVVFKMKDKHTGQLHAVKCFLKEQEGREDNYAMIAKELQKVDSPYILSVHYFKKELFVDTAQSDENEFPVLLMDWVEGKTLSSFLQEQLYAYNEKIDLCSIEEEEIILFELRCLPINFVRMASWLLKQPFAHGDIKPDNIIIKPDGTFVLIDYDGMFVPSMQGMSKNYIGTPNYRNPLKVSKIAGKDIDDYAISVIALSLCAYSIEPGMAQHNEEYCLITEEEVSCLHKHWLFKDDKLMTSPLFRELLSIYLHTISNVILDSVYYEKCVSEHLCPSNYDLFSTAASDFDLEHFWEDEYGVRYSLDGKKVLLASKQLKELNYRVREGVITICNQAFQGKELNSIYLPNSVIAIGDRAFANNDDMDCCNIPSNVKYIFDNNPWGGCFNIKRMDCQSPSFKLDNGILYSSDYKVVYGLIYWHPNIVIDDRAKIIVSNAFWSSRNKYNSLIKKIELKNVKEIGNASFDNCIAAFFTINGIFDEIGQGAFWKCKLLEKVDASGASIIPEDAFIYCENLREIKLSSKLKAINSCAFLGCVSLERLKIPSTTTFISEKSISGCTALKEFIVHEDNKYYSTIDGVLFNKGLTRLIKYPAGKIGKEFEIPDSVFEICDRAFEDCVNLERITCKNRIIHFGRYVFKNCPNLTLCILSLDDRTDAESAWNLGSFLFPLKDASTEMKTNGFKLISKAAEMEHSVAQWYLARCYKYGWNGEINIDKYISFMKRSAANNNFAAMSQLGIEYVTGKNTSKNFKVAYELFHKLEESGDDAENECKGNYFVPLGLFYEIGVIVSKDVRKAVDYYSLGEKWDNPSAFFQLGRCYEKGIGVEASLEKARRYYIEAQKHKFKGASEALERVEKQIRANSDELPF